jgi:EAL domain-containing protein (putative c-di-GMP-specific phosphodiesterase class I)
LKVIAELRDLGVGVDVDAFERFTSLATLQRFRPGRIGVSLRYAKDRPSPETDAMYGAMARLCGSMGAVGVAKAIDSDEILDWMKGLGYDEGQGFHLGAPGPAADIVAFLRADQ